jgi:hypothetical protein
VAGEEIASELNKMYVDRLNRLYALIGRPRFGDFERVSREVMTDNAGLQEICGSTANDVLLGKRAKPPKLGWTNSFVMTARSIAEAADIDLAELGNLTEWRKFCYQLDAARNETAPHEIVDPPRRKGRRPSRLKLIKTLDESVWLWEYGSVVPKWARMYLSLEPSADQIRVYETDYVPGLLQTEAYLREIVRLGLPGSPAADIDRRVELRLRRQSILFRSNATRLWAIVDERALRDPRLGTRVMREQIEHLIRMSDLPQVTLQILVSGAGREEAGGAITVLRFRERDMPDVIYLEQADGAIYPHEVEDIHHYLQVFARLMVKTEPPAATSALLHRLLDQG